MRGGRQEEAAWLMRQDGVMKERREGRKGSGGLQRSSHASSSCSHTLHTDSCIYTPYLHQCKY